MNGPDRRSVRAAAPVIRRAARPTVAPALFHSGSVFERFPPEPMVETGSPRSCRRNPMTPVIGVVRTIATPKGPLSMPRPSLLNGIDTPTLLPDFGDYSGRLRTAYRNAAITTLLTADARRHLRAQPTGRGCSRAL